MQIYRLYYKVYRYNFDFFYIFFFPHSLKVKKYKKYIKDVKKSENDSEIFYGFSTKKKKNCNIYMADMDRERDT